MANSTIKRISISNIGPFGEDPISIDMSDIVCLVGQNNSGKSTILDCYQLIFEKSIPISKINKRATKDPYVELWIEIPMGTPNIGDEWINSDYEEFPEVPIVRSRWSWSKDTLSVTRTTFDKKNDKFDGRASGLDNVFNSRLPKPLRIGALDQPEKEKDGLIKLILDPITKNLNQTAMDSETKLGKSISGLKDALTSEVEKYKNIVEKAQENVHSQYSAIFDSHNVQIKIEPHEQFIDIEAYLKKATDIFVGEGGDLFTIKSQGTGSQRTLFWSLLKVRSALQSRLDAEISIKKTAQEKEKNVKELNAKIEGYKKSEKKLTKSQEEALARSESELEKLTNSRDSDIFERSYILMIDEPEIALHPSAVRLAKNQLYKLAKDNGWQVIITTHHPAFIDPTEDHTTIVRVDKNKNGSKTFRSDLEKFNEDEKQTLSALLRFDTSFSEIFFSKEVIVVEGDTEYSVFQDFYDLGGVGKNKNDRVVVRAGGKGTIPLILRILRQFKIPHGILHDVDSPKTAKGHKNSAYKINDNILEEVKKTLELKVPVYHCVSVPNFEQNHSIFSSGDGKPLDVVRKFRSDPQFKNNIEKIAKQLTGQHAIDNSGSDYVELLKAWVINNGLEEDKKYKF